MNETETQHRLRMARTALALYREAENEARRALASAVASTMRAKERYEDLFLAAENEERARRTAEYRHVPPDPTTSTAPLDPH